MWKCPNCNEAVDDGLNVCWNCQTDKTGALSNEPSTEAGDEDAELKRFLNKKHGPKTCAVCQTALKFVGTKEFHEGINFGVLGDFGELFVQNTGMEMYVCPTCLRVEFFLSEPID
jgi:hypothetical protein